MVPISREGCFETKLANRYVNISININFNIRIPGALNDKTLLTLSRTIIFNLIVAIIKVLAESGWPSMLWSVWPFKFYKIISGIRRNTGVRTGSAANVHDWT